jgi:hypothetical protein
MLRVRAASPCSIWRRTDYEGYVGFISSDYREWPISRFGRAGARETALWPAGTFSQAYDANRRAATERVIDADTVAACVPELKANCNSWGLEARQTLLVSVPLLLTMDPRETRAREKIPAYSPADRAGRRHSSALGIEITFAREGRAGTWDDQDERHEEVIWPYACSAARENQAAVCKAPILLVLMRG